MGKNKNDVNWPEVHMFPEEAVQEAQTLGGGVVMPIHWGAFIVFHQDNGEVCYYHRENYEKAYKFKIR